ncbi:hypothetical protein VNO77_04028 [Canavalia gladiata]|uniref:Uncharacterized protein n=1 Tax=Canavalia gladiata TaxID=3824 RepID=A0AAN9N0Y5_CANGL
MPSAEPGSSRAHPPHDDARTRRESLGHAYNPCSKLWQLSALGLAYAQGIHDLFSIRLSSRNCNFKNDCNGVTCFFIDEDYLKKSESNSFIEARPYLRTKKSRLVKKWSIPGGNTYVFIALKSHRSVSVTSRRKFRIELDGVAVSSVPSKSVSTNPVSLRIRDNRAMIHQGRCMNRSISRAAGLLSQSGSNRVQKLMMGEPCMK